MIRAGELTRLRGAADRTLTADAIVYHKSPVSDGAGGQTDTFVFAFIEECSFGRSDVTPLERESSITVQAITLWNFAFPAGTVIVPTDRIVVGVRQFEVVTGASGSVEVLTRVICREII